MPHKIACIHEGSHAWFLSSMSDMHASLHAIEHLHMSPCLVLLFHVYVFRLLTPDQEDLFASYIIILYNDTMAKSPKG